MQGRYYEGVKCDIYIGNEAGAELLKDMRNARKSIKVVSPYLSAELVTELIYIRNKGIQVELVTSDSIEDRRGKYREYIYKLIIQEQRVDIQALEERNKWKKANIIINFLVCSTICIVAGLSQFLGFKELIMIALSIMPMLMVIIYLKRKISASAVYFYRYHQLFPFKVCISRGMTEGIGTDLHSKFYLIDDRIAYLGSLNFTSRGTRYNYETVIRTTDPGAASKIEREFDDLLYNSYLPAKDIQVWGQQLYRNHEPIN